MIMRVFETSFRDSHDKRVFETVTISESFETVMISGMSALVSRCYLTFTVNVDLIY